jgi:large subunit ribosomal protein L20
MGRVKKGVAAHKRHRKLLKLAKGYRGHRKDIYSLAKQAVLRAGQYAYRDRRARKRDFRSLWITRINIASRQLGLDYRELMNGLKKKNIILNRKVLSELAANQPEIFKQIVEKAK